MAHTLYVRDGDQLREASAQEVLERGATLMAQRFRAGAPALDNPARTREYLRHQIGMLPYEVFGVLLLDCRSRLIRSEILFRGTLDRASVHPREVARVVLESNAASVICYHNHASSGTAEPSQADEIITDRLAQGLRLLDIRLVDHIIIGNGAEYSFAEAGRL